MTKEELKIKLYERMAQENKAFLAEMRTKPVDEIISSAYEIACRNDLLMLFENETSLSVQRLEVLLEFASPLAALYADWLERETTEMDHFRDSVECCADDILRSRAEEKYRDPARPIYAKSRSEAAACGEMLEWSASRGRTLTCAGAFEQEATKAYNEGRLSAFLQEWTASYGKERCMFMLACTMAQRIGDERFGLPAQQAAGRFTALQEQMGGHVGVYAVDSHSCVVDAAMAKLAEPKRRPEREGADKRAQLER